MVPFLDRRRSVGHPPCVDEEESVKLKAIVAALAVAPLMAHAACESVSIEVLPFTVAYDNSWTFDQISAASKEVTFAGTFAKYVGEVRGCSVKVGYIATVRVSRELVDHPCAMAHVMAHEDKHVAYFREATATLAARIEARKGEANFAKAVGDELFAVKAKHAALDNPEEYRSNERACGGAILRLTGV